MAQAKKTASKAGGRAKTSSAGKNTKKKTTGSRGRGRKQQPKANSGIFREIVILLVFAMTIILFLSVLNLAGTAGVFLRKIQFGLFGTLAYVFPFLLFWAICFLISNEEFRMAAWMKVLVGTVVFVALCGIIELLSGSSREGITGLMDYYRSSGGFHGGLLGGVLLSLVEPGLGMLGAYVVLVAVVIAGVVFITERSFIKPLKRGGSRVVHTAREDFGKLKEQQAAYSAQKQERLEQKRSARIAASRPDAENEGRRVDQKIQGVALGQTLLAESGQVPEPEVAEAEPLRKDPAEAVMPEAEKLSGSTFHELSPERIVAQKERRTLSELDELDAQLKAAIDRISLEESEPELTEEELMSGIYANLEKIQMDINKEENEKSAGTGLEIAETVAARMENADRDSKKAGNTASEGIELEAADSENEEWELPWSDFSANVQESEDETVWELPKEDAMAAYDSFDAPRPESAIRQIREELPGKVAEKTAEKTSSSSSSGSIWKQGGETYGNSGVTFRDHKAKETAEPIAVPEPVRVKKEYKLPSISLLKKGVKGSGMKSSELKATALKLQQTLHNFNVGVTVTDISCGPTVTRYELLPDQGVKVSKIVSLADDIKLNLAAADIRIEAPIPGKAAIGIEVPNAENQTVYLRELLDSDEFKKFPSRVGFGVGRDIGGKVVVADLARMPHLLIAGATGSGKSVCINTLIMSILYKAKPDEVKLIMIDPKVVELSVYNGIPHLLIPVVTDPKKAAGALNWAVAEMTDRYKKFADMNVRDIKGYNSKVSESEDEELERMPQIVVIVDELADLMMVAPGEVEEAICRLAQLARAAGIHLVLATQRPSVNVITGLIKANVPSRIAFAVSSGVDSRTIIDMTGAEKLLGKGDMLFYPTGYPKPVRIQGAFVSDEEVGAVVEFLTKQTDGDVTVNKSLEQHLSGTAKDEGSVGAGERDEYFERCGRFIIEKEKASIGNLQRAFKIGFNRAARIMDQLADMGVVGPEEGTKPRQILMTMEQFDELMEQL